MEKAMETRLASIRATESENNLIKAFRLVSRCWSEVNGLAETLDELFDEALQNLPSEIGCKRGDGKTKNPDSATDDSDWVYLDRAASFPLVKKKGSKPEEMHISYQISFSDDKIYKSESGAIPLLHVSLWHDANNLNDVYIDFPVNGAKLDSNRLFEWPLNSDSDVSWTKRQWTYSLRLTSLNNRQDLLDAVISPAIALLGGKSALEALPDDLPGLMFFDNDMIANAGDE